MFFEIGGGAPVTTSGQISGAFIDYRATITHMVCTTLTGGVNRLDDRAAAPRRISKSLPFHAGSSKGSSSFRRRPVTRFAARNPCACGIAHQ